MAIVGAVTFAAGWVVLGLGRIHSRIDRLHRLLERKSGRAQGGDGVSR